MCQSIVELTLRFTRHYSFSFIHFMGSNCINIHAIYLPLDLTFRRLLLGKPMIYHGVLGSVIGIPIMDEFSMKSLLRSLVGN